jgi:hypothetical protein
MTERPQHAPPAGAWRWPVDLTAYDRSPKLDLLEQEALAVVVNRRDRHRRRDERAMATVDRLMRRVWDLLEKTGTHSTTMKHVEGVLLWEMDARQQAYWGWAPQDWLEVLSDGDATTRGYSTRPEQYRHRLLVVAYVLCGMGPQQLGDLFFFKFAAVMANQVFGSGQIDPPASSCLGSWSAGATARDGFVCSFPSRSPTLCCATAVLTWPSLRRNGCR